MKRNFDIDDMLNSGDDRGFDFREEYWDEMSRLLDERDRKRRLLYWSSSVAALVVAAGLTWWAWPTSQENALVENASPQLAVETPDQDQVPQSALQPMEQDDENPSKISSPKGLGTQIENGGTETAQVAAEEQKSDVDGSLNEPNQQALAIAQPQTHEPVIGRQAEGSPTLVGPDNSTGPDALANLAPQQAIVREIHEPLEQMSTISWEAPESPAVVANLELTQQTVKLEPEEPEYRHKPWSLELVAAGGLANRMANANTYRFGVNPVVALGADISYQFPSGLSFTSGIRAVARDGVNQYQDRLAKMYSFGVTHSAWRWGFDRSFGLEMPVMVGYHFNRHSLNLGMVMNYTIATRYQLETFNMDTDWTAEDQEWVAPQGMRIWSPDLRLGYQVQLASKFAMGAEASMSLLDVTQDEVFGERTNRDLQLRVYLRYQLTKW